MNRVKGFTLVEIMMVVVLVGVIAAAAFVFLRGGTNAAESIASRSLESSNARLAASRMESLLSNAGYMGEVFPGEWEPVLVSEENRFSFVANLTETQSYGPEDTITVAMDQGFVTITDASGADFSQSLPGQISFEYFDAMGQNVTSPDLVRRIEFTLVSPEGSSISGSVSPYNLAVAQDPVMLRDLFNSYSDGGGSRYEHVVFLEDFEVPTPFAFEDSMEVGPMWVPVISEHFEDPLTWNNNWQPLIEDPGYGRVRRWTNTEAYEGQSCLTLDCYKVGNSSQMAIWRVDLSEYDWSDDLRLHFYWKEFSDQLDPEDGVFLPVWVPDSEVEVLSEDFTQFGNGVFSRDWTYWTNDYGRVQVMNTFPTDGNYLNLDTRRQGYTGVSRVMATMDLSPYAGSTDISLTFDMCSRGSPNSAFVGLIGTGGISSDPVAQYNLNPGTLPAGSWITVTIDLDELIPPGYDLASTKLIFAQEGTGVTTGINVAGGVSFDNVLVSNGTVGYWDTSHRILAAPSSFPDWTEATVDLDDAAQTAGIPFSNEFYIGFSQRGEMPIDANGIAVDQIDIEEMGMGMSGWTHGTWPGYNVDEWLPSNHAAFTGSWCYAVAAGNDYQAAPTRAWLQSPAIDLTSYAPGERMAIAFFHMYSFGTGGDGCNVKISRDNGETWDLVAPYWGYYTASVPALGNEAGWTGATGSGVWNFSVIDITEYAGEEIRLRFNYGTTGSSSNPGWDIDYTRSRAGADWPQIVWGTYVPAKADWFAYSTVYSGTYDPTSTPDGSRWAGNDMSTGGIWNLRYENSQENALITPPIVYTQDNYDTFAYVEFYASPRFSPGNDFGYVEAVGFSQIAPDPSYWHALSTVDALTTGWGHYRYRVDNLPATVFGSNRTVVFRWRMLSNGSGTQGGWNIDRLRFFSTDTYLSNVTHGPVNGLYPGSTPIVENLKRAGAPAIPLFTRETPVVVPVRSGFNMEVHP